MVIIQRLFIFVMLQIVVKYVMLAVLMGMTLFDCMVKTWNLTKLLNSTIILGTNFIPANCRLLNLSQEVPFIFIPGKYKLFLSKLRVPSIIFCSFRIPYTWGRICQVVVFL